MENIAGSGIEERLLAWEDPLGKAFRDLVGLYEEVELGWKTRRPDPEDLASEIRRLSGLLLPDWFSENERDCFLKIAVLALEATRQIGR